MRSSPSAASGRGRRLLPAIVLSILGLFALPACTTDCLRNSDCKQGQVCGAAAHCVAQATDLGPDLYTPDLRPEPDLAPYDGSLDELVVDLAPNG